MGPLLMLRAVGTIADVLTGPSSVELPRIRGEVQGFEEAHRSLRNMMDERKRQRIMRGAMAAAGRVVRDAARRMTPTGEKTHRGLGGGTLRPGALRRSVRVSTRVESGAGLFRVRAKVIAGDTKRGVYWAHFLERGTREHVITAKGGRWALRLGDRWAKSVRHPGTRAQRIMEHAVSQTANQRHRAFEQYITQRLAKLAASGSAE